MSPVEVQPPAGQSLQAEQTFQFREAFSLMGLHSGFDGPHSGFNRSGDSVDHERRDDV